MLHSIKGWLAGWLLVTEVGERAGWQGFAKMKRQCPEMEMEMQRSTRNTDRLKYLPYLNQKERYQSHTNCQHHVDCLPSYLSQFHCHFTLVLLLLLLCHLIHPKSGPLRYFTLQQFPMARIHVTKPPPTRSEAWRSCNDLWRSNKCPSEAPRQATTKPPAAENISRRTLLLRHGLRSDERCQRTRRADGYCRKFSAVPWQGRRSISVAGFARSRYTALEHQSHEGTASHKYQLPRQSQNTLNTAEGVFEEL